MRVNFFPKKQRIQFSLENPFHFRDENVFPEFHEKLDEHAIADRLGKKKPKESSRVTQKEDRNDKQVLQKLEEKLDLEIQSEDIAAGTSTHQAAEVLNQAEAKATFNQVKEEIDEIIIDPESAEENTQQSGLNIT